MYLLSRRFRTREILFGKLRVVFASAKHISFTLTFQFLCSLNVSSISAHSFPYSIRQFHYKTKTIFYIIFLMNEYFVAKMLIL